MCSDQFDLFNLIEGRKSQVAKGVVRQIREDERLIVQRLFNPLLFCTPSQNSSRG
jgi:hypothetical protein